MFPVTLPPLRNRLEDIPALVDHFITRFAAEEGKRIDGIDDDALDLLMRYMWPGNVRQLENAVFRAVVLADLPTLTVAEFPQIAAHVDGSVAVLPPAPGLASKAPVHQGPAMIGADNLLPRTMEVSNGDGSAGIGIPAVDDDGEMRSLEDMEADMIRLALGRYRGHMTEVAKRLKIGRSTLYRKMRDFGLEERLEERVG